MLRYCNPVAAHPSGEIGEDPFQKPTNLFPVIQNIVRGTLKEFKEVVETYENTNHIKLNYKYGNRRKGDATIALPDCSKIKKELGWAPKIGLEQMCKDSFNYIKKHSN